MTTTTKLAGIATATLAILLLKWAVTHTFTLALLFAALATIAVVTGPAIRSAKTKLTKGSEPKQVTSADEVDWDAAVRAYKLPGERKTG